MARMMNIFGWILIVIGAALGKQIVAPVPLLVCLALYATLTLSAGVFEWLIGKRK